MITATDSDQHTTTKTATTRIIHVAQAPTQPARPAASRTERTCRMQAECRAHLQCLQLRCIAITLDRSNGHWQLSASRSPPACPAPAAPAYPGCWGTPLRRRMLAALRGRPPRLRALRCSRSTPAQLCIVGCELLRMPRCCANWQFTAALRLTRRAARRARKSAIYHSGGTTPSHVATERSADEVRSGTDALPRAGSSVNTLHVRT